MSLDLAAAARTLAIDGWTAEAARELRADGVAVLLLKGPAITRWLYARGEERQYVDADLLVAPDTVERAERTLGRIGYVLRDPEGEREALVSGPHAQTWWRPGGIPSYIDLHHTLPGGVQASSIAWALLSARAQTMSVGGEDVRVLDEPSRALLVALHALHHGEAGRGSMEDLRRAVAQLPERTWRDATMIAEQLMVLRELAAALPMVPGGAELARRVRLPDPDVLERLSEHQMASGYARFAAAAPGERLRLLRDEAVPGRAFMHWWAPWSRRSRAALAAAYAYRVIWLAGHAFGGWRAWRQARKQAS